MTPHGRNGQQVLDAEETHRLEQDRLDDLEGYHAGAEADPEDDE